MHLYSDEDLENLRKDQDFPCECDFCGGFFFGKDKTRFSFCSTVCYHKSRDTRKIYKCQNCEKDVLKAPNRIKGYQFVFCNDQCHRDYDLKVSQGKFEICEHCGEKYKNSGRNSNRKYCSHLCATTANRNREIINCNYCVIKKLKN